LVTTICSVSIQALVIDWEDSGPSLKFMWASSRVGIEGKVKADDFVRHTDITHFLSTFDNTTT